MREALDVVALSCRPTRDLTELRGHPRGEGRTFTTKAREATMNRRTVVRVLGAALAALMLQGLVIQPAHAARSTALPAGHWGAPVTDGACAGEYQLTPQEKADMSTTAWAHYPKQFAAVLCSGWKGSMDLAVQDVSRTLSIGGWTYGDSDRYDIASIIAMINTYWLQYNPGGTLVISGFHEMNGFWGMYAECRGKRNCQMRLDRWAALQATQYRTIKAGLSPKIKVKFTLALNYTTHAKVGTKWYTTTPDAWIKAAVKAKVPFDYIGVSMYQNDPSVNWPKFKTSRVVDQARCLRAKRAFSKCSYRAPIGPDSWVAVSKQFGKPLMWREWGGKRAAWMAGAKKYLALAMKSNQVVAAAHLYDASRKACHYAQARCYYDR